MNKLKKELRVAEQEYKKAFFKYGHLTDFGDFDEFEK